MKPIAIFLVLMLVVCTVWASDSKISVPELEEGDILFCQEYPYRTVNNTSRTVYQLVRLGFTNIRSFQDAHGLIADGIIGSKTQQKVESEFNKQFNINLQKYTELNMLSLSVNSELTESIIAVTVTMRNTSDDSLRIVGSINYDADGGFLFQNPTLSIVKEFCTRENGRIAHSHDASGDIMVCAMGTTIKSLKQISVTASLPKLNSNQSGSITIGTAYINSTLSMGTFKAGSMIPKEEKTANGTATAYNEPIK